MKAPKDLINVEQMPAAQPGEPMLLMSLNGKMLAFPIRWARLALFLLLPEWLRDSTVDPPAPDAQAVKAGFDKELLKLFRSGLKNMVRPFLGKFMRGIYGPDEKRWPQGVALPKGREDALPIIDRMLIDFIVTQAYHHPLLVEYDETSGIVQSIRPGHRVPPTVDTGNADHAARQG